MYTFSAEGNQAIGNNTLFKNWHDDHYNLVLRQEMVKCDSIPPTSVVVALILATQP